MSVGCVGDLSRSIAQGTVLPRLQCSSRTVDSSPLHPLLTTCRGKRNGEDKIIWVDMDPKTKEIMTQTETQDRNRFLLRNKENPDFNQYWYSAPTIAAIVAEIEDNATSAACVSCPSIYFSIKKDEVRKNSAVLDLDEKFNKDGGYIRYDFNEPTNLPEKCKNAYDYVVIDPPFITREVWEKFTETAKFLLKDGGMTSVGKLLCTTVRENKDMMKELLDVHPNKFQPSIPNLVYQYDLYTNYESSRLSEQNPEIPEDY